MFFEVGDAVPLQVTVRAPDGSLADAGGVTAAVTVPDGTVTDLEVTQVGTGVYSAVYWPSVVGKFSWVFTATAPNACTFRDVFHVLDAAVSAVSIDAAREHLRLSSSADDEKLRFYCAAGTQVAEDYVKRFFSRRVVTAAYDGGVQTLLLRAFPVVDVTSVTEYGSPVSGWVVDPVAGVLHRGPTRGYRWAPGYQNIRVTSTVGRDPIEREQQAVLEIVRHLWDTQRGGSGRPAQAGAGDTWAPGAGFSLPRRAQELLGRPGVGIG